MSRVRDVAIVGGGPAGLALAILTARRGLDTVVLERRGLPSDKACGEGLMPRGVRQLGILGMRGRLTAADAQPFAGIRYVQEDGTSAEARFPNGQVGLGIRRVALSQAMVEEARSAGAEIRERTRVVMHHRTESEMRIGLESAEELRARFLVAADGLASPLRREAGLEAPSRAPKRFGLRQHFALRPWADVVEVHFAEGVEAYITPAGSERVGIAFLWEQGRVSGAIDVPSLLKRFPRVEQRLGGAREDSSALGAGPLDRVATARTAHRLALLGDAAGYVDALTGEGLSLAFSCAFALAEALSRGSLDGYEEEAARAYRPYEWLTRSVLAIARRPRLRRRVVRGLSRAPGVFASAVAAFMAE